MKIAIVGYGNMGREVERIIQERGHDVAVRVDPLDSGADESSLTPELLVGCDAAIEFSLAEAVLPNARVYAQSGVPAVVGTTGWEKNRESVKQTFADGGTYLSGSNFSIGAHIFFAVAEYAARLCNRVPEYDLMVHEIHHKRKKDSPSGTALTAANRIVGVHARQKRIVTERLDRPIEPDELHVSSLRGGSVPGVHAVIADSAADTIEISHTVRNRTGLALGSVLAAEWLADKVGFYEVEDFVSELLNSGGSR